MKILENKLLQEKYYVETLDNGLKVILIPKNDFYTSYAILSVKYGSKDTEFIPYGKTEMVKSPEGIAHFLEHKLFECDEGVDVTNLFSNLGNDHGYQSKCIIVIDGQRVAVVVVNCFVIIVVTRLNYNI